MPSVKLQKPKNPRKKAVDVTKLLDKVPPGQNKPTKAKAQKAIDDTEFVYNEDLTAALKRRGLKIG